MKNRKQESNSILYTRMRDWFLEAVLIYTKIPSVHIAFL